ncbi:hypothetical protein RJT34_12564 [Clitoria ternatea]|uniref:Uncharacterized protein n=1 Tax=Clitoria ternatea TaxID=43366 RepID=A0AAN9JM94_CLITE
MVVASRGGCDGMLEAYSGCMVVYGGGGSKESWRFLHVKWLSGNAQDGFLLVMESEWKRLIRLSHARTHGAVLC